MSGIVYVDNQKEDKAGSLFDENAIIEIRGETLKYVSRGGLKLDKAVTVFNLKLDGYTCLDIGASTGGFTDVMLQNGAKKVYSVDVGHGQLDWKLRNDERVVCMEKCNFRYVTDKEIPEKIDFAATDVSFISLTKILIPAYNLLKKDALMVCLIKPQFETTKEKVGKKGVVRDPSVHKEVIEKVIDFCLKIGFGIEGLDYSEVALTTGLFADQDEMVDCFDEFNTYYPGRGHRYPGTHLPNYPQIKQYFLPVIINEISSE